MSNQAVLTVIKKGLERAGKYIRMRPLCVKCSKRPCAVNYKKGNKTYYRKQCEMCLKYGGPSGYQPKWYIAGYRTKTKCDNVDTPANINNNLMCFTWTAILIIVDLTI